MEVEILSLENQWDLSKIKIDLQVKPELMEKTQCMGCQTSFKENEKVILENLVTEYKNFQLPLKDDKAKWTILKTIVSFLNSQGGTIYLGIEDSQGAVQGLLLERKERDNFKLFLKHLIERIHPRVDLNNRQEVVIQFVPVLRDREFQGKHVVKIIVQQGDPSQVYYFGEKIKLEGPNGKIDEIEQFYAYERHNMGGTTEIKGLKLLQAVHTRAKNPNKLCNTFHEGCNPEPPHLEIEVRKLLFTKTTKEHLKLLEGSFKESFDKMNIDYESSYLRQEQAICVAVEQENEFKIIQTFVTENIQYLNDLLKDQEINFQIRGEKHNYFLIENNSKPKKQQNDKKKEEKKEEKEKNTPKFNYKLKEEKIAEVAQPIPKSISESPKKNYPKKYGYTFTHILPRAVKELQAYLTTSMCKSFDKQVVKYVNTVEVFLNNQDELDKYATVASERAEKLAVFGFKGQIRFGRNNGCLRVCNYDKGRRNQLAQEVLLQMGTDVKEVRFDKDERGTYSLLIQMKDRASACQWLDTLLQGRLLTKFGSPGSEKKNSKVFKLKIYLDLDRPDYF